MPRDDTAGVKKSQLQPWRTRRYCIPERDAARFVAQMEDILDVYARGYDETHPLIAMDEAAVQLLAEVYPPQPMQPGAPAKEDYHYERRGVRALFMFFDPLMGWRRVSCREHRTRIDWALEIQHLLEVDYPHAQTVTLVCDNLNTHTIASLYEAFEPQQAHRLARRLDIHYTPRNGSWLNVAEIELSILARQCLKRRIADDQTLSRELAAWQHDRNQHTSNVSWRFTTEQARSKLQHLYPKCTILT